MPLKQLLCNALCILSMPLLAQESSIKATYDSIMHSVDESQRDRLITEYVEKHKANYGNRKGMEWFYHEYAKLKNTKNELKAAIRYAKKAVAIREQYGDSNALLKKSLYNLGYFYEKDRDYYHTVTTYQKLVAIAGNAILNAKAYSRMGLIYSKVGDFRKAESYYDKVSRSIRKHNNTMLLFRNHINRVYTYGVMDRLAFKDNIFFHLGKVDSLQQFLEKAGKKISNRDLHAINLAKGNLYDEVEAFEKAVVYHKEAFHFCKNALDSAGVYNNLGITTFKLKAYKEARNYYTIALKLAGDDLETQAMIYDNLGDYYLEAAQDHTTALEYYQKAIMHAIGKPEEVDFHELPDWETVSLSPYKTELLGYLIDKAKVWIQYNEVSRNTADISNKTLQTLTLADKLVDEIRFEIKEPTYKFFGQKKGFEIYNRIREISLLKYLTNVWIRYHEVHQDTHALLKALETLTLADQLVDNIRFESTEYKSKLFWRKKGAAIYNRAIAVCYDLNQPEKAFYFLEKNKALLLLEDLTHETAKDNAKLPDSLGIREYALKQHIVLGEKTLLDSINASKDVRDSITDLVFDRKRTYEKFITNLERQYPDYYNYKRKLPMVSYEEFLANQPDDVVTVHYMLNNSKDDAYGLLIAKNNTQFFKIDSVAMLHKNITLFREKLSKPFITSEDEKSYQKLAFALYKKLFPDVDPDFLNGKKLHIIADGVLQHIPFESLMTSPEEKHAYVLNRCEVYYDYSISFSTLNRSVQRHPKKTFMGFAPVQFKAEALAELPESEAEISQIMNLLSGDPFLKVQASKHNFTKQMQEYKIIHLATHADGNEKGMPWIAFHDSIMRLDELYATKNQAHLVVLSGCNTSQGELKTGEGLMSLARAFLNTGTESVVASLWNVNDKATQEITTAFYEAIKKGHSKAKALQYAKQAYLKKHNGTAASPYYWSALILIGDDAPMHTTHFSTNVLIYIGFAVIVLLVLLWGRRYFLKKRTNYK